ncbi:MAG TPA: MIP/aquaporin family protein [Actinomycetota bacterium]|nr:MIP/aquaporin family protein [Actinomycetota bacterium]
MSDTPRAAFAELIGTFVFVTIGAGAVIVSHSTQQVSLLGIAAAHGLALAVMVTVFGGISGGHFNPAVTIGVLATGKIKAERAAAYVGAQLAGATLAGLLLRMLFVPQDWSGVNLGTPGILVNSVGRAILFEAVLTLFLVLAVWGTGVDPRGANVGGFGIGLMVFACILVGGPITGAAMNPARHFGPALASGFFPDWWVYWLGPVAGAAIGSLVWRTFFSPDDLELTPSVAAGASMPPSEPADADRWRQWDEDSAPASEAREPATQDIAPGTGYDEAQGGGSGPGYGATQESSPGYGQPAGQQSPPPAAYPPPAGQQGSPPAAYPPPAEDPSRYGTTGTGQTPPPPPPPATGGSPPG